MVRPLHFVIVEDDFQSAESMRLLLERQGHRVQICMDALSAVDFIRGERPNIALVDIMMPAMDGIEVCRRLHSQPGLKNFRTVVITGKVYAIDHQRALAAGASGVIVKPIDPKSFVDDVLALANDNLARAS